jgi:hypothetical protein
VQHDTGWSHRLSLSADGTGLVGHVGAVPLRLLTERTGLTGDLSAATARAGRTVLHDRGRVLADLAVTLVLGGKSISDIMLLKHLTPLFGPTASIPTVWRTLEEIGPVQRARIIRARTKTRRRVWQLLKQRPEGFPWIRVDKQTLTGWIVLDADASIVTSASEKQGAAPTFKHTFGHHPLLVTCDNTAEMLVNELRPGNAGSNTAIDNIAALEAAIQQVPGPFRKKILFRIDGAGASHDVVAWIASGGGRKSVTWEFSVGWPFGKRERETLGKISATAWSAAIDSDGEPRADARVADITGLLELSDWPEGTRVIIRDEPLHPRYRKDASELEKNLGRRFQLIATNTRAGQICWLDARHRAHAHVENCIKNGKDTGLRRLPSRHWDINAAWCQIVAIAADLLAWLKLLALDDDLAVAEPKTLRYRILHVPAKLVRGQRRRRLKIPWDWPWAAELVMAFDRISALPAPT